MKNKIKLGITLLAVVLLATACGLEGLAIPQEPASVQIAQNIQAKVEGFADFKIGGLTLQSSRNIHQESITAAENWLTHADVYGLTEQDIKDVTAWQKISTFFANALPDTEDVATEEVSSIFLGILDEETNIARGVFIYEFVNGVELSTEDVESANEIVEQTSEYFILKENCVVSISAEFLTNNGLSFESIKNAVDGLTIEKDETKETAKNNVQ